MTLIHISLGLMTVAMVVLYIANHKLIKSLRKANDFLKDISVH